MQRDERACLDEIGTPEKKSFYERAQFQRLSRRNLLQLALVSGALALGRSMVMAQSLLTRTIPRTRESLPVIGLGTWQTFDVSEQKSAREPLKSVLREFVQRGGSVIDSSPMYGNSESTVGDIATDLGIAKRLFLATKVWTRGREAGIQQMEESFRRLKTRQIDLMQVHNLVDWRTQLATLQRWKEEKRIRYIGVTHYTASAYDDLAGVLESQDVDFVQLNYSIAERLAERRLLPLAMERQIAVLVNRPFAEGALFRQIRGKSLPAWAKQLGCATWSQFFLKFIISHPAVTCAIPATSKLDHLSENMQGGTGPLPDRDTRERMARYVMDA
jgi:diketogulonate reductase-like aldo/keto reductase